MLFEKMPLDTGLLCKVKSENSEMSVNEIKRKVSHSFTHCIQLSYFKIKAER